MNSKNSVEELRASLISKGLKITPQRIIVLEAVMAVDQHPTVEKIIEFIKTNHPNIAIGTVYKTLETFVENGLIGKVKTDKDSMRYDAIAQSHHHLYSTDSEKIEDYFDDELNSILNEYFAKKKIKDFVIEDFRLQIIGKFRNK